MSLWKQICGLWARPAVKTAEKKPVADVLSSEAIARVQEQAAFLKAQGVSVREASGKEKTARQEP